MRYNLEDCKQKKRGENTKMTEKILLCVLMVTWISSMISCFTIGVLMGEHKKLEKFAILPIIICMLTTFVIGTQWW